MISFHKLLSGAFVIQLFLGTTVLAATAPSYLAPANSFMYLESNTTQANPLKGQLENILKDAMGEVKNQATLDTVAKNLDNTTMGFSTSFHQTDGSDIYLLSVALPESDFQIIIDELATLDLTSTDIGQQKMIYLTGNDFYFTYKDGNLIASNIEGMISDQLLVHDRDSISKVPAWQFLNSKSSGKEFFRMLINFEHFPEDQVQTNDLGTLSIMDLIHSEGFAIEETSNGLKGLITVKPGSTLAALATQTAFMPELYKKVNAQGVLLYSESNNWAKNLETSMQLFSALSEAPSINEVEDLYTTLTTALLEATGLNMETDIKPLFQNRSAFAMHDESTLQYAPAFTLLSEVKGQESKAQATLAKMHTSILTSMTEGFNEAYDQEISYREKLQEFFADDPSYTSTPLPAKEDLIAKFFSTDSQVINGVTLTQITFNPDVQSYFYDDEYTEDLKAKLMLSSGITAEGLMIITTSKNPEKLLSTNGGLSLDSEWQKSYSPGSMSEISFINVNNVSNYIEALATAMGATDEELTSVLDFLAPFHSLLSQTTYDSASGYYIAKVMLNMDTSTFDNIAQSIGELFSNLLYTGYTSEDYWNDFNKIDLSEPFLFHKYGFADVNENDWFAPYTYHMANLDIMKGYNDGSFRPSQNITRAEFTKTILMAYEKMQGDYFLPPLTSTLDGFSDVHSTDWFNTYVNRAKALGLVDGYNDGSFRPNQSITRAEAVTILIRVWELGNYYNESYRAMPFNDVNEKDWFYSSVEQAYNLRLINGKTTTSFAPADNLSRAETATMVSRFLTE